MVRIYQKGASCVEQDCPIPIHAKGLCMTHYKVMRSKLGLPRNNRACRICGRSPVAARDLCEPHYSRWKRGTRLDLPLRLITPGSERQKFCTEDECDLPVHARNKCRKHYVALFCDPNGRKLRSQV